MPSDTFLPFSLFCQIFSILNNKTAKQQKLSHFNTASDLQMYQGQYMRITYGYIYYIKCIQWEGSVWCFKAVSAETVINKCFIGTVGRIQEINLTFSRFIKVTINQKRSENCIIALSALLQKFSVLFWVDTLINRKNIRFISYYFISISIKKRIGSF